MEADLSSHCMIGDSVLFSLCEAATATRMTSAGTQWYLPMYYFQNLLGENLKLV